MSKLKDKLSANIRTIQRTEAPTAQPTIATEGAAPEAASSAEPADSAGQTAQRSSGHVAPLGFDIPTHSTALFPARVWPD